MMRVGILASGMEVESLKAGFETSPINPDYTPPAPPAQPYATMLDPTRLHLAPSEKLRIHRVLPGARATVADLSGSLVGAASALSTV